MKNKALILAIAILAIGAAALARINTDALYVDVTVLFFVVCIAYATWCERL